MSTMDSLRIGVVGGRRGGAFMQVASQIPRVALTAVCDVRPEVLGRCRERYPGLRYFLNYEEMLASGACDAVVLATPPTIHAMQAVQALRSGKHVLCEVIAGITVDELWSVVRTVEETGLTYMMAENACYFRPYLMVLNMVQQGVFGDLTFAQCGYVHELKSLTVLQDGVGAWRYEWQFNRAGNFYPTHAIGPVAWWIGLGRTDRMLSLVSMDSKPACLEAYIRSDEVPAGHPAKTECRRPTLGDVNKTLIRTEKGVLIDLWFDVTSNRPCPTTTCFQLQGLNAAYDNDFGRHEYISIKGRTKGWDDLWKYSTEYEHPLWRQHLTAAEKTGHGGADYFSLLEFAHAVLDGQPPPIDVYDAADWSVIIPLSQQSVQQGSAPVAFPDFRKGRRVEA